MSFLQRLSRLFAPAPATTGRSTLTVTAQCARCGEIIAAPVDLRNDLSADYDEATGATTYVCRKVLLGRARCFQPIEVMLRFDQGHQLLERDISGGKFVEPTS